MMEVIITDVKGLYCILENITRTNTSQQQKSDVKPADTNPTAFLPLGLQTLKQRAKLVTPQPSVTLRDAEAWQAD